MKIVFLQLSDLHLQNNKGTHPAKIQAVVNSLATYAPFEGIVSRTEEIIMNEIINI